MTAATAGRVGLANSDKGWLKSTFGKVAAVTSLVATLGFYGLGAQISKAYYDQWQENKAVATSSWDYHRKHDLTENLPWAEAGGALGVSLAAGFTGIALGKRRRESEYSGGYSGSSSYRDDDDNFWLGYILGSSGRSSGGGYSSGGSSSKDNGGAVALLVILGAAALAVGSSVVSYKAMKANFSGPQEGPRP